MPENANPLKVASMRRLGAEIVFHGEDFDDAGSQAEADAERSPGATTSSPPTNTRLVTGVATYTLEILRGAAGPRRDVRPGRRRAAAFAAP